MRAAVNAIRAAVAAVIACAVLAGCALTASDSVTAYNSLVREYHHYETDGTVNDNSVLNLVYNSSGDLSGRFEMQYDASGNATRTDFYSYDSAGTKTYNGYYLYEYDAAGNLTSGKTYNSAETLVQQYDETYDTAAGFTSCITRIADYTVSDSGATKTQTADRVKTYQKDSADPGYGQVRTDQYFTFDSAGTKSLTKEYAYWYWDTKNANNVPYTKAVLYHVRKGSDTSTIVPNGMDEAYYYQQYSYDTYWNKFLEADCWYGASSTKIPATTDAMIASRSTTTYEYVDPVTTDNDPFTYEVVLDSVRDQMQMVLYAFDEYYNCTKESWYSYGVLQEMKVYRYEDQSRIAERSRYVDGGSTLEQREVIRYYDADLDGVTYQVKETTTYYYGDASDEAASGTLTSITQGARSSRVADQEFSPVAERAEALVAAYGDRMFRKMRDIHE